jgi:cell wall-associated NlpC family hydrolase
MGAAWRPCLLRRLGRDTAGPGHVGIVVGDGEMIEAYATGYPIRVATYGRPSAPPGDQAVAGFTRP